jgi:hypothetical protein
MTINDKESAEQLEQMKGSAYGGPKKVTNPDPWDPKINGSGSQKASSNRMQTFSPARREEVSSFCRSPRVLLIFKLTRSENCIQYIVIVQHDLLYCTEKLLL